MTFSLLFVTVATAFLSLVSLVIFLIWHSYRLEGMLGGLIIMWVMITAFLAIVFFTERKSAVANTSKPQQQENAPSTLDFTNNL